LTIFLPAQQADRQDFFGGSAMANAKQKNIIITCAVTGSTLTPSMSPYLPVTADQMIEQSVGAAKAGASILHPRQPSWHRLADEDIGHLVVTHVAVVPIPHRKAGT
jgi:beta-keto acid cleavage enzyme